MLSILLPFLLFSSTLAAPSSPPLPGHMHRLGRRSRSFLPVVPERPPHAHAGRLSGSRVDAREHSPAAIIHDIIPDSGEIWELADAEPTHTGFVLQAEAEGRRGVQLGEEMITRAWTELISRPESTGLAEEEEEGGGRRSWFEGEYVGELHEAEAEEEGRRWWTSGWSWMGMTGEAARGAVAEYWGPAASSSSDGLASPAQLEPARFQMAPKPAVPEGGWVVSPRGEWYLVHLE